MDETTIITILTALIAALGIKEIWNIWKKKIDANSKLEIAHLHSDHINLKTIIDEQRRIIEGMCSKIDELEEKIDQLVKENKACAVKLARLEERIILSAKKNSNRKRTKDTPKKSKTK